MSGYDIVGDDWDDDDIGSIGAELEELISGDDDDDDDEDDIGAEADDFLEALAVSGDGTSEIIGADLIGKKKLRKAVVKSRKRRMAKRLAKRIARKGAKAVVRKGLNDSRRYPLGFLVTPIGAGATVQIPAAPQDLFRGERLIIPSSIAFSVGVVDLKVGNRSQFVQAVEVPGSVFTEVAVYTGIMLDTAEIGNQISVFIINNSGAALNFTAAAIGTVAK